jgi:hypothetical protein
LPGNTLSREFRLVSACCEWPASADRTARLQSLAGPPINWDMVLKLSLRHRVEGLVHRALAEAGVQLPQMVAGALAARAAEIGRQNLLQSAESARLSRLLAERGIDSMFLKGVALGALAYDTIGVKQSWDIDLLVAPQDAGMAAELLVECGYRRTFPGPEVPDDAFQHWIKTAKETLWTHPLSGLVVELHTALVDNPQLLPSLSISSPMQTVPIGAGIILPTLRTDELFAYLCLHGAWHAWARLKWLADVAALARKVGPEETERLYRRSLELGGGRSAGQALLLCAQLLALPLTPGLAAELRKDRAMLRLEQLALRAMASRGATELDDTVFGTVVINLSHFLMGPGWGYKYGELTRKTSNPEDRLTMKLPPALGFVYTLLAVPRWVLRRYRLSRSS